MEFKAQIDQLKQQTEEAKTDLLRVLSYVPDDKLTWSPSETARDALWMVGHCAAANDAFTQGIRGEAFTLTGSPEELGRMIRMAGKETKTREEAVKWLEQSTASYLAALDVMSEARYGENVDSPFGPMPVAFWSTFAPMHMTGHARQLDYLQTIWGDLKDHMN